MPPLAAFVMRRRHATIMLRCCLMLVYAAGYDAMMLLPLRRHTI